MCGVAGVISKNNSAKTEDVYRMTQSIRHRGPDDEGYCVVSLDNTVSCLWGKDTFLNKEFSSIPYYPIRDINSVAGEFKLIFGHRRLSILDLSPWDICLCLIRIIVIGLLIMEKFIIT